jgi:hypothetical protein
MATPRQVNAALKKMGSKHTFHRKQLGGRYYYYYFTGGDFKIPSLYVWTADDYPLKRILGHYKATVAEQEA